MGMFGETIKNFDQAAADALKSEGIRFGSELGLDSVNSKVPDGIWEIQFGSGEVQVNRYSKDYGTEDSPNKGGIYSDAVIVGGEHWKLIDSLTELERTVKVKLTEEYALQLKPGLETTVIVKTGTSARYAGVFAGRSREQSPEQIKNAYKAKLEAVGTLTADQITQKLNTVSIEDMKLALA